MSDEAEDPELRSSAAEGWLVDMNGLLSDWTACSAEPSAPFIECLETLGYAVRDRSRDETVKVLRRPPTRATMDAAPRRSRYAAIVLDQGSILPTLFKTVCPVSAGKLLVWSSTTTRWFRA